VQRKGHCQILLARIGTRNQLELEDRLNRPLNELGKVCQELNLKGGPGWQEDQEDPAFLT
jgi:hypothetical protein